MTTIVNHDIRSVNGKYIMMPPWKEGQAGWGNLSIPNTTLDGGDTAQQYPVNAKFVDFDRTHIYGYCNSRGEASVKANIGLFNQNKLETVGFSATAGAVGDTLVGVVGGDLDDNTSAAANIFAGGYFMPRTNPYSCYRVVKNTAYLSGRVATEMDLTIEDGLTAIVAASVASCFLNRNPYTKMRHQWGGAAAYRLQVVGVTLIDPTASTYQWVQTWGPVHIPGNENPGSANSLQQAYFHIDGSVGGGTQGDIDATFQPQLAGYVIGDTSGGMTWFTHIMLER